MGIYRITDVVFGKNNREVTLLFLKNDFWHWECAVSIVYSGGKVYTHLEGEKIEGEVVEPPKEIKEPWKARKEVSKRAKRWKEVFQRFA